MNASVLIQIHRDNIVPSAGRAEWLTKHGVPAPMSSVMLTAPLVEWQRFGASVKTDGSVTLARDMYGSTKQESFISAALIERYRAEGSLPAQLDETETLALFAGFAAAQAQADAEDAARKARQRESDIARAREQIATYDLATLRSMLTRLADLLPESELAPVRALIAADDAAAARREESLLAWGREFGSADLKAAIADGYPLGARLAKEICEACFPPVVGTVREENHPHGISLDGDRPVPNAAARELRAAIVAAIEARARFVPEGCSVEIGRIARAETWVHSPSDDAADSEGDIKVKCTAVMVRLVGGPRDAALFETYAWGHPELPVMTAEDVASSEVS